jgi:hypothetical protein
MAVGIDLGFVALELAQLTVGERVRRQITATLTRQSWGRW